MSKLDFSRQIVTLGDHTESRDVISSFRTAADLPHLSDDILENSNISGSHDTDKNSSPQLIGFEDTDVVDLNERLFGHNGNTFAPHKLLLSDYGFCDITFSPTSSASSPTSPSNNPSPLRRWHRRAQDVSLAAVGPSPHWPNHPSPATPSSCSYPVAFQEDNSAAQAFNSRNSSSDFSSSSSPPKQLATLKNAEKRTEAFQENVQHCSQSQHPNYWNDTRRNYSCDSSSSYASYSRSLSESHSLAATAQLYSENRSHLRQSHEQGEVAEKFTFVSSISELPRQSCGVATSSHADYLYSVPAHNTFHTSSTLGAHSLEVPLVSVRASLHRGEKIRRTSSTNTPHPSSLSRPPVSNMNDIKLERDPFCPRFESQPKQRDEMIQQDHRAGLPTPSLPARLSALPITQVSYGGFGEGSCAVCGDKARWQHYGVLACEGCKGFFKVKHGRKLVTFTSG